MTIIDSLDPDELAIISSIVAVAITKGKSAEDINVIGNFIASLGAAVLTIAAQEQYLNAKEEKRNQIMDLENQIDKLKKDLK